MNKFAHTIDTENDIFILLNNSSRNMPAMHAHDFYKVCGLIPQTVRQARLRARKRGEPDPVPMLTEGTYNIDLVTAIGWLQRTSRYGSLIRLKVYFDDMAIESVSGARGRRNGGHLRA